MPKQPYMPRTADGIAHMLVSFDTNINADSGALAAKYGVTADELRRITRARLVWTWFIVMLNTAREWAQSLTGTRDTMTSGAPSTAVALPGGPVLPPVPNMPAPPSPANTPALLEPGFFTFFGKLASGIKDAAIYEVADGILLGIEGAALPPPNAATTIPPLHGEIFTSGHPELSCRKGEFQGFDVLLTRPGQAEKNIGFSTGRRFMVMEPLPAPGVAEVWTFRVQYRYQGQPFGQMSQPLSLTVRG